MRRKSFTYRDEFAIGPVQQASPEAISEVRLTRWEASLPRFYRGLTVPEPQGSRVTTWWNRGSEGLWLAGPTTAGKTLAAWTLVLKFAATEGMSWHACQAAAYLRATRGLEDRSVTQPVETVQVLLLDEWPSRINARDVDVLRHLLTIRAGRGFRTVITANGSKGLSSDLLASGAPADRAAAEALHSRLARFSQVTFTEPPSTPRNAPQGRETRTRR